MPLTAKQREDIAHAHYLMTSMPYVADILAHGRPDFWEPATIRTGGDCEDIVLAARRHLIDRGWDYRDLRPTLCEARAGMHMVLTIMLGDAGEIILDREQAAPLLPSEFRATGCRLLQRWAPDTDQWEIVT